MDIPPYPDSRELEIADKIFFDSFFTRLQPRISEFSFANLYLFRKAHDYRISRVGDSLVIFGKGYDGGDYFLPPMDGDVDKAIALLLGEGRVMYGADESFVKTYLRDMKGLEIIEDRDSHDYLYLREELAELPGNRYHKKKNRVNYFTKRHSHVVESFSATYLKDSLRMLDEWSRMRPETESPSLLPEIEASGEALRLAEQLGLKGLVVLVEGEVKAFALGEKLNDMTSVCHFEKSDTFLEGLSQLIDREFARLCFTDCTYVNREQDLGEANLRRSKLSYHPVEMIRKYRVRKL
jgi:hypothetical protein